MNGFCSVCLLLHRYLSQEQARGNVSQSNRRTPFDWLVCQRVLYFIDIDLGSKARAIAATQTGNCCWICFCMPLAQFMSNIV